MKTPLSRLGDDLATAEEIRRNPCTYFILAIGLVVLTLAISPTIMASGIDPFWKSEALCWLAVFMVATMSMGWRRLTRSGHRS